MSFKERLLEKSTIKETALLEKSRLWEPKDIIVTGIPALNIALSGKIDGGMVPGILQIAGETQTFKSKFAIEMLKAFQKKFPVDGMAEIWDSEHGTPKTYFDDVNKDNVIHTPVITVEQLTHDINVQLEGLEINDRLLGIIDSLGNLASIKEKADALSGKDTADFTRPKAIRSLFRTVGPIISNRNVYLVVVNHTYRTIEIYSKEQPGGGGGTLYNSDNIWIISSSKNKEGADNHLTGFDFTIKVFKSRFVKRDSKIPITVNFDSGIDKWSGLLDLGVESKHIIRPNKQKYALAHKPETEYSLKQLDGNDAFYEALLNETNFNKWVEHRFCLKSS